MNESNGSDDTSEIARPHPRIAAILAFAVMGVAAWSLYWPIESLLIRNWIVTFVVASAFLFSLFWVFPKWAPNINGYLWRSARNVSVTYSASVALVSFFVAILVCLVLVYIAQWKYPPMTDHWRALWSIGLVSGLVPLFVVIYLGLEQAGATRRFSWLDAARMLLSPTRDRFNDRGRLFILIAGTVDIAMIQGGIVLTGGVSISPFNVLLVLVGSVAAIASERPVYPIFTVLLACQAAAATEVIGSFEPPSRDFYPTAHIVVFLLSMAVGLLVDLGRKSSPTESNAEPAQPAVTQDMASSPPG